jgi:predicted rRNA pseudouridine synthase
MDSPEKLISNGIIIIDKPCGQASHEITSFVKKITGSLRSGHAGTLDPQVSGVLPIALGKATKLLRYIAGSQKEYVGIIKFRNPPTEDRIKELFMQFTGEIEQMPPKKSAVRRKLRKRTIYELEFLEKKNNLVLFRTRVDAGTYIRTLCVDIGKKCGGARMEELRRVSVGSINEKEAHTMQDLIDAMHAWKENNNPKPIMDMIHRPEEYINLPKVQIRENALKSVFSGAQVMVPAVESFDEGIMEGSRVCMFCGNHFIGVGIARVSYDELEKRKHGIAVKLERVHKA